MERKRAKAAKLADDDSSTKTTFHYNARSSSRKGISNTDSANEPASLRVTEQRKKKISDDLSTKSELHLPIDLIVEILKYLPAKTLVRFLCVSKVWASIIRSRHFKKLFLAVSSNRPGRLFFTFRRNDEDCILFSSNPGEPSVATYHVTSPVDEHTIKSLYCVHDLICYTSTTTSGTELVVYNSTTKRSITLPKLEPDTIFRHFFCYDPIDAVYKVLYMTLPSLEFKILTLGGNGNEWRVIEDSPTLTPISSQICTNGVLYYDAFARRGRLEVVVMSFDVRLEKFDLIKGPIAPDFKLKSFLTLSRYEGKLAMIPNEISCDGSMVLWVLEDALKHQWLKKVFVLPNSWTTLAQKTRVSSPPHVLHAFLNITDAGELILTPLSACVPPFYVLYYDPKRKNVRKVSIEGIMEHPLLKWKRRKPWFLCNIFSSQYESLTFW